MILYSSAQTYAQVTALEGKELELSASCFQIKTNKFILTQTALLSGSRASSYSSSFFFPQHSNTSYSQGLFLYMKNFGS